MKVTVNVDCSPEEARKFLGLPDVQPLQQEMMKIMREKTIEGLHMMEPDVAMKMWAPLMNQGVSSGMDMFKSMMTGATMKAATGSSKKKNR